MTTGRKLAYRAIPPAADAEFAAGMEEVLEVCRRPHDPAHPVVCMDEQPVQSAKETRTPIPATRDRPRRVDYDYERDGTASLFPFCETSVSWRQVAARPRRTEVDRAEEVGRPLRTRYARCETVTPVCDDLNAHARGAFREAFEPAEARTYLSKPRFRRTPEHGSRLNVAECELSCLTRQRPTGRRMGTPAKLRSEAAAWSATNATCRDVDRQFTTDQARIELKSLYPKFKH